jgi:hypothetical protein
MALSMAVKKFKKNCPNCNTEQTYTRKDHYTHAKKLNRICRACSNKTEGQNCHMGCYKEIAFSWFNKISRDASARGLIFELSIEDIWLMLEEQNFKCNLSGVSIMFNRKASGNTASVDRIDSSKDYTQDNTQLVHVHINMMKQHYDQQYFIDMCKNVSEYKGN